MLVARTSRWPGNRQVVLAHGEGRVGSRLLDISCLDEREVRLDLLQRPTRSYQAQQMLNCKPVSPDARLATHLAGLDGDAVKAFHTMNVPWARAGHVRPAGVR